MGEVTVSLNGNATKTISNKKIIDIDGFVFEDVPNGKANATDNAYNSGTNDKLLSGIKVHLKNTNNLVKKLVKKHPSYWVLLFTLVLCIPVSAKFNNYNR